MAHIPSALREQVSARASGLCEYCHTRQEIVVAADVISAVDPTTGGEVRLFHPSHDHWTDHFGWSMSGLVLIGRTPSARATIQRLRINRDSLLNARKLWKQAGWHPPKGDPIQT